MLLAYSGSTAAPTREARTPKQVIEYLERRMATLRKEYEAGEWRSHHMDLSDFILPRRGKFLCRDKRKGRKVNRNILSPVPFRAAETFANGLCTGLTSKARLWFNFTLEDDALLEMPGVRRWLSKCERLMQQWMDTSNLYSQLPEIYVDLAVFGTTPSLILEDYKTLFRVETFEAGEYLLAKNARGVIDALFREYEDTVENIVTEFGLENCSEDLQKKFKDRAHRDDLVRVGHGIEPNLDALPGVPGKRNMAYRSVYWERDCTLKERFLRYEGYEETPLLAPRWSGKDVYGRSAGMDALPECKALKQAIIRKEQGKERLTIPPMVAPASLKNAGANLLPGGVSYLDATETAQFRSVYEKYDPRLDVQMQDIKDYEAKIRSIFYNDLLFAISNMDGVQPRNVIEIMERKEEKLQQLGGGVERFETEFLEPLIDRVWAIAERRGMLPPPPRVIDGKRVKVIFVGPLALAQKSQSILAMERTLALIGSMAKSYPEAGDKLDTDKAIDEYVDLTNTPTSIIRPDEEVAAIRKERRNQMRQEQAARAAPAIQQVAAGAELLSRTRTASGRSALEEVEAASV